MHNNVFMVVTFATASSAWPLQSPADRLVDQAQSARERAEFRLAASLLDEAEKDQDPPVGRIYHERGLLARDSGHLEEAATELQKAVSHHFATAIHLDHAGVLVQLGRWPEAVVVLRHAFDERGSTLLASAVGTDERFVKLTGFSPYDSLLQERRLEEESPFFKLTVRMARIERSTLGSEIILDQIATFATLAARLANSVGAPIFVFVLLGLVFAFGIQQTALVGPPWTIVLGMTLAGITWHLAARFAGDDAGGGPTIAFGVSVVFGPWLVVLATRGILRWRQLAKIAATDPFSKDHLPDTLAVLEEVTRLGRRWMVAEGEEKEEIARDLDVAQVAVRQRFDLDRD
ncbi:MAG: hypothetical protein A2341_23665 [Deltaproteobacteria bacterium RIFOXYB12_FULL_58_9]|nr:MAG: hypothetical protein A2341_23665 [Deltaproteobacteria bacterium RIFOXYB12_FULL_58_9]